MFDRLAKQLREMLSFAAYAQPEVVGPALIDGPDMNQRPLTVTVVMDLVDSVRQRDAAGIQFSMVTLLAELANVMQHVGALEAAPQFRDASARVKLDMPVTGLSDFDWQKLNLLATALRDTALNLEAQETQRNQSAARTVAGEMTLLLARIALLALEPKDVPQGAILSGGNQPTASMLQGLAWGLAPNYQVNGEGPATFRM